MKLVGKKDHVRCSYLPSELENVEGDESFCSNRSLTPLQRGEVNVF